uniref:Uncharacterized protein n=1 Tax=Romanomermis culicivorax TaxID=13658 RepID=A0A915I1P1_ROMCU
MLREHRKRIVISAPLPRTGSIQLENKVAGERARTFCSSNVRRAQKTSNYIGTISEDWIDSVGK